MVGKPPKLSRADMDRVRDWVKARRELGTIKHLAETLGVSKSTAQKAVTSVSLGSRMYKRELA